MCCPNPAKRVRSGSNTPLPTNSYAYDLSLHYIAPSFCWAHLFCSTLACRFQYGKI